MQSISGKPQHRNISPTSLKPLEDAPATDYYAPARKEGQPDYLMSRENYMKLKRAGATIPDFAHKPDDPGPRRYPYASDNIYLKPHLNPNTTPAPKTNRVAMLQSITEDSMPTMESNLNPNHRMGRYQPGMIGWGVGANYLIDR